MFCGQKWTISKRIIVIVPFSFGVIPIAMWKIIVVRVGFVITVLVLYRKHTSFVKCAKIVVLVIPVAICQSVSPVVSVWPISFVWSIRIDWKCWLVSTDCSCMRVDIGNGINSGKHKRRPIVNGRDMSQRICPFRTQSKNIHTHFLSKIQMIKILLSSIIFQIKF